MPTFQVRNRFEIFREMAARLIARGKLSKLYPNGVIYHVLKAASGEDAEQYLQLANLRKLFDIDQCTGSDLDERAAEMVPYIVKRRGALFATTTTTFARTTSTGATVLPAGTIVAATDAQGSITFRTTAPATIPDGQTSVAAVPVVATQPGARANVAAGQINRIVTRVAGVNTVTNPAAVSNGQERESDQSFRGRLKIFVQAISRGTPVALEGFAQNVIMPDGRRVLFAQLVEPVIPTGIVKLYIDDGTGAVETYDSSLVGHPETLIASALGGELNVFTTNRPIRDDGSFILRIAGVVKTRGTDYNLNAALGQIELLAPLVAGQSVTAEYRFYTGLIQAVQRVIDGDPTNPSQYPGVRAAGIQVQVLSATLLTQTLVAAAVALDGYDAASVFASATTAVQTYINGLGIGEQVIAAAVVEKAMDVPGMYNFKVTSLSGSNPATDQVVLAHQVARITAANISIV